jgi:glycosyltransferase involved in cell wall biosynthesis
LGALKSLYRDGRYPMKVSIVIPTKNEAKYLPRVIDSLLNQDYPLEDMEILIVDGRSTDHTRDAVEQYRRKVHSIRLIDNPQIYTVYAFNAGIKNATGDIIFFVGAHTEYSPKYVSTVVKYIQEGTAECVGSVACTLPGDETLMARSIALVLSSPFGVGNSYMRTGQKTIRYTDTASCSGYKRDVFDKIGLFNEKLIYSQDIEFNLRLRKAGMRILLVPDITSYYYARPDLTSFCKHNFRNGLWSILPFKYSPIIPISMRHLIPLTFVMSLLSSFILSFFSNAFLWLFCMILGSYGASNLLFSGRIVFHTRDLRYLIMLPVTFACLHLIYGMGSMWGLITMVRSNPREDADSNGLRQPSGYVAKKQD